MIFSMANAMAGFERRGEAGGVFLLSLFFDRVGASEGAAAGGIAAQDRRKKR